MDELFAGLTNNPWFFLSLKIGMLVLLYGFVYKVVAVVARDVKKRTLTEEMISDGDDIQEFPMGLHGLVVVESSLDGIKPGAKYPLKKAVSIGRGSKNSIEINDSFVSHEHARLFSRDGIFFVEDLKSKNGTLVDGKRVIQPVSLGEGALLQIGGVTFKMVRWENEGS